MQAPPSFILSGMYLFGLRRDPLRATVFLHLTPDDKNEFN